MSTKRQRLYNTVSIIGFLLWVYITGWEVLGYVFGN